MSYWQRELMGVGLLSVFFLGLLGVAEFWCRKKKAKAEWTRKLVHVGGGVACIAIPWLVQSIWVVLAMSVSLSALFALGGKSGMIKSLHGVSRKTRGSEYYPFAIFLLFVLSGTQRWLYVSSVLVLAVADGFAALIGTRYGSVKYEVEKDQKSLEGSLGFLVIAFLAMHLPMLLMTDLPGSTCVLAAFLVAVLVTGFEAVSLSGTDNIFVPLGVCVILSKIVTKPTAEIIYQILSMMGIGAFVTMAVVRTKSFNMGGALVFFLFCYGSWSLGSEMWAFPIIVGFLCYMIAWLLMPLQPEQHSILRVSIVFRAVLLPLVILLFGNMFSKEAFFYGPFVAALGTVVILSLWNHTMQGCSVPESKRMPGALAIGVLSWFVVVLLPWVLQRDTPILAPLSQAVLLPVIAVIDDRLMGREPLFDEEHIWDHKRLALTAASGAAVMILQLVGVLPNWVPS